MRSAVQYYEKLDTTKQKAYVQLQCHCALCNSTLELSFEALSQDEIKEEARCPVCEIKTRAKIYSVH